METVEGKGYRLILGDCLEAMRDFSDKQFEVCITDPPYGIGISSNPFRQKFEKSEWDDAPATKEHIDSIFRVSSNQVIWGGNYFHLPPTRCFLIWDKVQPEDFSSAMVEFAWTSYDSPAKLFRRHVVSYKKYHPTTKPLELMRWVIANYTKFGDTILDPFAGSGSTLVAAMQTGRNAIGIERDPGYFEIMRRRVELAAAQPLLPGM